MKIYIKSLLKLIRSNLSRFITLILIVVLGIGFLVGIFGVSPDLEATANSYFKDSNMSELYLMSTTGFLPDDITYIDNTYDENVTIRATYEEDRYIYVNDLARVGHLVYTDLASNATDKLELVSGRMPEGANEVVVERNGNYLMNIEVDSTIKIDDTTYKVVGVVANSWYMMKERYDSQTINASLDTIVYLPIDNYLSTISDSRNYIYTNLYLYFGLEDNIFSNNFLNEANDLIDILKNSDFENNHYNAFVEYLRREAQNSVSYDEAILNFLKEFYGGSLGGALETLVGPYEEVVNRYNNGETINFILFEISKDIVADNFTNKTGELYNFDISSYVDGATTLGVYIDEQIENNINDGINEALSDLTFETYYLTSLDNYSTAFYQMNVDKVEDVAIIFPIFFFIIASLVALTSLRRLVFEERVTMGTLRALGYSKFTVLMRYIIYGVCAAAIGSILGIGLGIALIPSVIYNIFNSTCHMPPFVIVYDTPFVSAVVLGMIALIILVVVISVYGTLKETPANLLIPKAPKPGRRIFLEKIGFIWKHLSFKYKSSIRNMIRYKRNLFMMIIGVGGCTALILLAFGLQDSMDAVSNKQYEDIVLYDAMAAPTQGLDTLNNSYITKQEAIYYDTFTLNDYTVKVIGSDEILNDYFGINIEGRSDKFTSNDVLISKLISKDFDLNVGDIITYNNVNYTITGVFENYIDNFLFIGSAVTSFTNNRILLNYDGIDERAFTEELLDTDQIISIEYVASMRLAYNSLISNISLIVVVILFFAAFLAVVVIFNLMNINVSERKRELATLKVLGYKNTEVHGYIARETFILTIVGMLVGIGVGFVLHQVVANIIDTDTLMAGRQISVWSYLYAILLTLGFSLIVDLCFIPYYKKISMTDSLKAVE